MTSTKFDITLFPHQEKALGELKSGSILWGGVGTGKTYTGLAYYKKEYHTRKLYVITTAKKRDSGDWINESNNIGVDDIVVDSWNNIKNYINVKNAFFIFDEQRVVGYNAWGKAFIKISKNNKWIMLTGTPGDTWSDYIPVFIANGFYKHKTEFIDKHVEYDRFSKFPKIKAYHNQGRLIACRKSVLVPMEMERHTIRHRKYVRTEYDKESVKQLKLNRWNPYTDKPILNASEFTQVMRKIVATHDDRIWYANFIISVHDKIIVFYNYKYELDILIDICKQSGRVYKQWNGNKHESIPESDDWIYLVQYTAGAEGWNCIETSVILFYSLNYSYKIMEQAEGRIDRMNTPYIDLEYFILTSNSDIDKQVQKAIRKKKKFNIISYGKERK